MNSRTFFTVVATDLKLFFADKRAVVLTLARSHRHREFLRADLLRRRRRPEKGTVALPIADADGSPLTKKIVEKIKADKSFVVSEVSEAEARAAGEDGKGARRRADPQGLRAGGDRRHVLRRRGRRNLRDARLRPVEKTRSGRCCAAC